MEDGMKIVSDRWMLQSRQIVNWGSYGGWHEFRPSMDGTMPVTLLAGASESGKSTLVDAQISLLYPSGTPYNKASNSGRSERNDYTYLRGMIGVNDSQNGETPIFLRGRDADGVPQSIWGAIVDTYVNKTGGGLLSCGGWIYDSVMELPLLKRVILIGPDEEAFSRVESEIQEKVEFLSREKLLEMEEAQVCAFVSKHVGKLPLYISVDKDVLCKDDADTNWSQGDMRLNTMLECLKRVREICAEGILGVDICGECDVAESGNGALNDRANAALLECFLSAYGSEDHDGNKNEITGGNR